jgi:murein DD-endopeptidase MepM/ murein hydrolase activator NlpD
MQTNKNRSIAAARTVRAACYASLACLAAVLAACGTPVGPGFYRVERGDTLAKIARSNGQNVGNLTRWNKLSNPNAIDVGQVLRVTPPGRETAVTASTATARTGSTGSTAEPLDSATSSTRVAPSLAPATSIALVWPTQGKVIRRFNGVDAKGLDITAAPGTPIVAAADGTVVYSGDGLRGYGNLLIVKHNADFLTVYAHNRVLLAKEGHQVKQGQTIAEMGDTDNDRVALHFELRYDGKSIDPSRYLPTR